MSEKRKTDFSLNRLDDLFTSQNERENGLTPTIKDIPLEKLVPFPNHPFKVRDDEEMNKLVESVSENGVLVPAIVREKMVIMKSFQDTDENLQVRLPVKTHCVVLFQIWTMMPQPSLWLTAISKEKTFYRVKKPLHTK